MTEFIVLVIVFSIPLVLITLRNTLIDLYFWQLKEYRWDRFWNTIRWDLQKVHRKSSVTGTKFILFAMVSTLFITPLLGLTAILLTFIFWTYQSFNFLYEIVSGEIVRPRIKSVRNLIIILVSLIAVIGIILVVSYPFAGLERPEGGGSVIPDLIGIPGDNFMLTDVYVLLGILTAIGLVLDLASPLLMIVYVILTQPLALIKRYISVSAARRKLSNLSPKITVIGITGSQGKTTTKEILYTIVKDHYNTVKTPENYNTDLGVADTVMRKINNNTEVFIAEMGAYRKGEIERIVKNFPTDISIITDIDTQHLALFGSAQKLLEAKYEIVKFMKPEGLAILNGDNFNLRQRDKDSSHRTVFSSIDSKEKKNLEQLANPKTDIAYLKEIKHTEKNTSFTYVEKEREIEIKINRIPEHNMMNLLMAIIAASNLNIKLEDIKKSLEKSNIELPRLVLETGDNDTVILNDSYSASRKGFIAAVKEMKNHRSKGARTVVITKGILELGKHKKSIYDMIFNEIAKDIDILVTTDHALADAAMVDNEHMDIHLVKNDDQIIYKYRELTKPKDVVLLEGRLHPSIISSIVSDSH